MNLLDKFRYSKDDPGQLSINLENYAEKKKYQNHENLSKLLSNSVKVSPEIFPEIAKAIDNVFQRLKINNNFTFFVTANHFENTGYMQCHATFR